MFRSSTLALALLLCASAAHAQITLTGAGKNHSSAATPVVTALGSASYTASGYTSPIAQSPTAAVNSGETAFITINQANGSISGLSVTDSHSQTYTCVANINNTGLSNTGSLCYHLNSVALTTSDTLSITISDTTVIMQVQIGKVSGVTALDVRNQPGDTNGNTTNGVPIIAATATTTASGVTIGLVTAAFSNTDTWTQPGGWTALGPQTITTNAGHALGYKITSAGAQSWAPTLNDSGRPYGAGLISFK